MEILKNRIQIEVYSELEIRKYIQCNDFKSAIEICKEKDFNSRTCFNIAMLSMKLEKYEDAILYFEAAIKLDSWLSIAYCMYGILMQKQNRLIKAIELYDDAILTFRNHKTIEYHQLGMDCTLEVVNIFVNRIICLYNCGLLESAELDLSRAQNIDPSISSLIVQLQKDPAHSKEFFMFYSKQIKGKPSKTSYYMGPLSVVIYGSNITSMFKSYK